VAKHELSRREREILDIVYRLAAPTAVEVRSAMAQPPTDGAVRATLRILGRKGLVRRRQDGPRFRYLPAVPRPRATQAALRHLLDTFFAGSTHQALTALLDLNSSDLTDEQRSRLKTLIEQARQEGR